MDARTPAVFAIYFIPQRINHLRRSYINIYHFFEALKIALLAGRFEASLPSGLQDTGERRAASHAASASPIGVEGGPLRNGQISSAMRLQLAVAWSLPSTA